MVVFFIKVGAQSFVFNSKNILLTYRVIKYFQNESHCMHGEYFIVTKKSLNVFK